MNEPFLRKIIWKIGSGMFIDGKDKKRGRGTCKCGAETSPECEARYCRSGAVIETL